MRVLAILETRSGNLSRASIETVAAAQSLGGELHLASVGDAAKGFACAQSYAVTHPLLASYTADGYALAFEQLIRKVSPDLILLPHTYQVRDFAPKLATRFGTCLVSDAIALGENWAERSSFQGKLTVRVALGERRPSFVSLQAGAWKVESAIQGSSATEEFLPEISPASIRQTAEPPFQIGRAHV